MAATAWQLYNKAKQSIGNGTITLGAGVFKMVLAATASNASTFTLSTYASITSEISATGGYATGGKNLIPATARWTVGASAKQYKFTMSTVGLTLDMQYYVIQLALALVSYYVSVNYLVLSLLLHHQIR